MYNKLEAIIFDADGTIIDSSEKIFYEIGVPLAKEFLGITLTEQDFQELRNYCRVGILRKVSFGDLPSLKKTQQDPTALGTLFKKIKFQWGYAFSLPRAVNKGWKMYKEIKKDLQPVSGIIEVIKTISNQGYDTPVLTSNRKESIYPLLHEWGLNFMEVYHCPTFLGLPTAFGKTAGLKKLLKDHGLRAFAFKNYPISDRRHFNGFKKGPWRYNVEKVVCVADEVSDTHQFEALGVNAIYVSYGWNNEEAFLKAGVPREMIVRTPAEILSKIDQIERGEIGKYR